MIAVLCLFFGFITLFAALTYVLYWYDTANGPALDGLRSRSQGHPRLYVLRGFLWALIAQTLALLTFPLGLVPRRQRASRPSANTGPIIITIHGLYHNQSAFLVVHRALRRAGFHDVRSWSYASWSADFFQLSAQLARDLKALHQAEPLRPIVLIGHSLGGLLARHAAVTVGSDTLAGCITLGTPHQGSRLAVFALGPLGRSLRYCSPLIEKIQRDESSYSAPNFSCVALASPVDNMVLPTAALEPPESHWNVRWTPPMSHVAMLYHRAAIREIVAWVKECTSTQNRFPGGQRRS